ncbi:ER lumen protein-retaining receptor 1-A [Vulpes lagopus]
MHKTQKIILIDLRIFGIKKEKKFLYQLSKLNLSPPPSSQLLLGHQLRPPQSGAHPRAPLPPPSPATGQSISPGGQTSPACLPPAQPCQSPPKHESLPTPGRAIILPSSWYSHLLAIILLLLTTWKSRSRAGISGKSRVLFAAVLTARYPDLFTDYMSLHSTCMTVVYLARSFTTTTVWMIYSKFKATYDGHHDTVRVEFLAVPTAILAFLVNPPVEVPWTFPISLESGASCRSCSGEHDGRGGARPSPATACLLWASTARFMSSAGSGAPTPTASSTSLPS